MAKKQRPGAAGLEKTPAAFTVSEALDTMFSQTNSTIAVQCSVPYSRAASWRKRYKNGKLSTDLATKVLLAFGFKQESEHRFVYPF